MLERYLAKANKRRSIHWIVNFAIKLIKFGRILPPMCYYQRLCVPRCARFALFETLRRMKRDPTIPPRFFTLQSLGYVKTEPAQNF